MAWAGTAIERNFWKPWLNLWTFGFCNARSEFPLFFFFKKKRKETVVRFFPISQGISLPSKGELHAHLIRGFVLLGCNFFLSRRSCQGSFLHHLVALSFSFALPNIFHIRVSLTSVSSSPPVRPWAGAFRRAVLYFQLLYRSCALPSRAGVCVTTEATAETQGKSSFCHYFISLWTIGQFLLGCKGSRICNLRAFQTSKYFHI